MTEGKKTELETIHTEALKRFSLVENKERSQRKLAIEDARFVNAADGQWEDEATESRAGRPRYTIDRVSGAIDQLVGNQRQNRTSIKVRPVSGGADEDLANIYNGLIRNIEARSKAENAYDAAFDEEVTGGYGGWRILTEFNDDDSFEQDIKIKWLPSAASSLWFDPSATEYDKRDGKWAFVTMDMQEDEYKERWHDASITDFSQEIYSRGYCANWFREDTVKVAEYWVKTPVTRIIGLLSDGRVIDMEEEKKVLDEIAGTGVKVINTRKAPSFKVVMYKMNGAEILDGPKEWAGKFIPLIPVYGKVSCIENDELVRGLTRKAKDPQRIYNYATSAAIEAAALSPKDPIWMTPAQALGHEQALKNFPKKNSPFMFYNHDAEAPGVPQRTGAPSVQTALIQQVQQAGMDIESTTGIFAPALGNAPQLLSEKSVISQAEKGDRGSYVFEDNLQKSIQYCGDQLIDLLPKIYDTPRMVRILNVDGTSEVTGINQESLDDFNQPILDEETKEVVIVNDLSKGKYETIVETGPAFNTQRQESASQLIELAGVSPRFEAVATDLIAKNLNILENDELTKRIRRGMIQDGLVEPTEDEIKEMGLDQEQPEDPNAVALRTNVEMQTEKLISDIEKQDAETKNTLVKTQGETIKSLQTLLDAYAKQQEMGIPLGLDEHEIRKNQEGIIELIQDEVPIDER